jgi:hypothetical protein
MERKFESELGKSVVEGKTKHSKKVFATLTAAVTCALMFGSAAFLLPVLAEQEQTGMPVTWIQVNESTLYDYVFFVPDDDPETDDEPLHYDDWPAEIAQFEVKRAMNLKVTNFDQSNSDSGMEYNKFVYSMGVNVQSLDELVSWDKVVGELSIPYDLVTSDAEEEIDVTSTITVATTTPEGVSVTTVVAQINVDDSWVYKEYDDDEGKIYVKVSLGTYVNLDLSEGDLSVVDGDSVSIQINVKVPSYMDFFDQTASDFGYVADLMLVEEAFSGLDDY